jgi:hypothetical protein
MCGAVGSWPRPFAVGALAFALPVDGASCALVGHTSPDALIARGPIDSGWLHALADRHRLVVHSEAPSARPIDRRATVFSKARAASP